MKGIRFLPKTSNRQYPCRSNPTPRVYLSGPITGQADSGVSEWRDVMRSALGQSITFIDPSQQMVVTDPVFAWPNVSNEGALKEFARHTATRNRAALLSSDLILVNLLGRDRVSIGCVGEIFWADAFGKPALVIREPVGNIHDHLLLNELTTHLCHDIQSAIELIKAYFTIDGESASASH